MRAMNRLHMGITEETLRNGGSLKTNNKMITGIKCLLYIKDSNVNVTVDNNLEKKSSKCCRKTLHQRVQRPE